MTRRDHDGRQAVKPIREGAAVASGSDSLVLLLVRTVYEHLVTITHESSEVSISHRLGEGRTSEVVLVFSLRRDETQSAVHDILRGVELLILCCRLRSDVEVERAEVAELHLLALCYEFEQTVHERHHHSRHHASWESHVVVCHVCDELVEGHGVDMLHSSIPHLVEFRSRSVVLDQLIVKFAILYF